MLKAILTANATSCLGFGVLFTLFSTDIAAFVGDTESWIVLVLGIGLIANGVHLGLVARKENPKRLEVLYFSFGDAAWVVGTIFLILAGIGITTNGGILWALGIAGWVGLCGFFQWRWAPNS